MTLHDTFVSTASRCFTRMGDAMSGRPKPISSTKKELAERHGVSVDFIEAEIRRGRLRARKFGRATRILDADEEEWLVSLPIANYRA